MKACMLFGYILQYYDYLHLLVLFSQCFDYRYHVYNISVIVLEKLKHIFVSYLNMFLYSSKKSKFIDMLY
jgi:hypothetical protein